MLRIEAGLIFAGYEFDDQTDPFEAGIPFTVPLKTKEEDFIGREALLKRKAHPQRVLVGLQLNGEELAAHGDCVHVGRNQVGIVTSGVRSPVLKKNIALCRMAVEYAAIGTEVEVGKLDGHQKRLPAKVIAFPFYDPEKNPGTILKRTIEQTIHPGHNLMHQLSVISVGLFSTETVADDCMDTLEIEQRRKQLPTTILISKVL